ncbi:hypothetical protein OPT61_g4225 [Boeremia exigua]|uniref:Uncharacterized protein n=1 Tax=Boeremia exigua TaxID=749465 RepID=A0ACC2IEY6_9PLEO|nr:hypothetical protein OPT61_g4225 [Boeremia exigua]
MRSATAALFGLVGFCSVALAQDAACTAGIQAVYVPLVGNTDAAEYCFDKVLDRSDDSVDTTTTASTTFGLRRRDKGKGKGKNDDDNSGGQGGNDDDREVRSLLKSLSKGPFSVASTFCSCNFPVGTRTAFDDSPRPTSCGFPNGTINATITSDDSSTAEVTLTTTLNATITSDDSTTITPIATLTITTTSDDDTSTSTDDDDSSTTTTTSV